MPWSFLTTNIHDLRSCDTHKHTQTNYDLNRPLTNICWIQQLREVAEGSCQEAINGVCASIIYFTLSVCLCQMKHSQTLGLSGCGYDPLGNSASRRLEIHMKPPTRLRYDSNVEFLFSLVVLST